MPDIVQDDLCRQSEIGRMIFDVFVAERIKTGKTNLWSHEEMTIEYLEMFWEVYQS